MFEELYARIAGMFHMQPNSGGTRCKRIRQRGKRQPPGSKLAKRARQCRLTLCHKPGLATESFRENAKQRYQANNT